jgi:hypothetical protein
MRDKLWKQMLSLIAQSNKNKAKAESLRPELIDVLAELGVIDGTYKTVVNSGPTILGISGLEDITLD